MLTLTDLHNAIEECKQEALPETSNLEKITYKGLEIIECPIMADNVIVIMRRKDIP